MNYDEITKITAKRISDYMGFRGNFCDNTR